MFVGFNLHVDFRNNMFSTFYDDGNAFFEKQKATIHSKIDDYIWKENFLDASVIAEEWFRLVDANVFISHSHKDQELAVSLAGWLYECFDITSFVDSCIWGYADDLLKSIDKKYCVKNRKPNGKIDTYDYRKRNLSTAHVHMLLNTALHRMIDKTECVIFFKYT